MAVVKDNSRPSFSSTSAASSLPNRQSYNRTHSTSFGSYNQSHRITRRKSSTLNPAVSAAAISAAVNIAKEEDAQGTKPSNRRSISSRMALGSLNGESYPSPPSSFPHNHPSVPNALQYGRGGAAGGSAVIDGPSLSSLSEKMAAKGRIRRASESSTLAKKKAGNGELKCDTCGKGYKHSSCLTKHLWEHTPEWGITSKLLISKHQQVQLLEAASVLVAMNVDAPDLAKASDSDNSSDSPAASGSSDPRDDEDDISSAETTPPPHGETVYGHKKQYSNASSAAFSRSYQSVFSNADRPSSSGVDYSHHRQWSTSSNRPVTAGTSIAESYPNEDEADLAAAVGLLSCSYGTPQSGPVILGDIPPVPPLPAKYQGMAGTSYQHRPEASKLRNFEDINMDEESSEDEAENEPRRYATRLDPRAEDDDGIFGNMEE